MRTALVLLTVIAMLLAVPASAVAPTYAGRTQLQAIAAAKLGATSLVAFFTHRTDPKSRSQIRRFYDRSGDQDGQNLSRGDRIPGQGH